MRRTLLLSALSLTFPLGRLAAAPVDFASEVAPILAQRCLRCHNAEEKKGKWSLSTAADFFAKRGGHEDAVVRGDPDGSLLVDLVTAAGQHDPEMPKEGTKLSGEEIAVVRRWIAEGAVWPEGAVVQRKAKADSSWWSLQPIRVIPQDPIPGTPPIDSYVGAKLAEKKLSFNPPAAPRDLIRRATYDLIGLPPAPEEVEAFVAACAASPASAEAAYAALVDRLLASPRYGEQWGRHWLDVVRFGESSGFERNLIRDDAWPFRDYIIRSFNEDKPFDQLITEHLAGDQLAPENPAVEVGTGFLVAGPYDDVGNQDVKAQAQIRANTLDDVVAATGSAFLGLTVHCARCHDHKFDPIPQADYYRLQAAVAGVKQGSRPLAGAEERAALAALRSPAEQEQAAVRRAQAELQGRADEILKTRRAELLAGFTRPAVDVAGSEDRLAAPVQAQYVRFTVISPRPVTNLNIVLEECEVWTAGPDARNAALAANGATVTAKGTRESKDNGAPYKPENLIDGKLDQPWIAYGKDEPAQFTLRLAQPETIATVVWTQDRNRARNVKPIDEYQIEVSLDGKSWERVSDHHNRQPLNPARLEEELRLAALPVTDRERWAELKNRSRQLDLALAATAKLPTAWIGKFEQPGGTTYLMKGGDPQKHGPEIAPASLAVAPASAAKYELPLNAPEGERRLALARWIVSRDNPLTPRVLANRIWHWHFGTGLVDTPSDFGYMGGRPTHPELLDYLAQRLLDSGWQLKPLHREIMLSRAYRQSSASRPDAANADHDARLLWRFPPRRLSAEELRDSMLAVSGRLDLGRDHGPGFRLYRYLNDNVSTYEPLDQVGPETYRRAVFHQNARASTIDLLSEFDAPDCAFTTPRRSATTTPLQALTLFNHAFTLDMATAFAERLRRETGGENSSQIKRGFAVAYGRPPEPAELVAAERLVAAHGLPAICRALLNSNELLYLP